MRVSVIVTIPAKALVRESSQLAFSRERHDPIAAPTKRGGFLVDPAFPPLPMAARTPGKVRLAASHAEKAPVFAVRGTIDASRIDDVRSSGRGVQIFADPQIGMFKDPYCGVEAVGTHTDVARLLKFDQLKDKGLDGKDVALAVMDTGVNLKHLKAQGLAPKLDKKISWAPSNIRNTPGDYVVDHGTMCAYDALIAAPACSLLDFPILQSETPGGSVMAGFLSDALLAFSYLHQQFTGPDWKYKALVINNSWGMYHPSWDFPPGHPGRYADNPNHPFNIMVGTIARAGADVLFAAGNCGADCPSGRCQGVTRHSISGANAHPDVLTLAACDIDGVRLGYSSQGPAIPNMAREKPDLTSYSHFLGSQAFGEGTPDTGTSTASPVAAGCVAAIRSGLPSGKVSPRDLFDRIKAEAQKKPWPKSGWNNDYGAGIIDPLPVAEHFGL
ncbi:peptidase S8 [Mesorhizobium loti]|nr:S8/S53 family peptidase [Mesorhizobium loti]PLP58127.1 peptidase S8 [Mesorhizobium loti]